MNVVALLQMALALLASPQVQANPAYLAEATSIANTAIVLAEQSTAQYAQSNPVPVVQGQDMESNPTESTDNLTASVPKNTVNTPSLSWQSIGVGIYSVTDGSSTYTCRPFGTLNAEISISHGLPPC